MSALTAAEAAALLGVSAREVAGTAGRYFALEDGRIWSVRRGAELKPARSGAGYRKVSLFVDGGCRQVYVHRLVAQAFIPNPDGLPQVNHRDGDKTNNAASNLEWTNGSDNRKHAWRIGLSRPTPAHGAAAAERGKRQRSLSEQQVAEVMQLAGKGLTHAQIAAHIGGARHVVKDILTGSKYRDVVARLRGVSRCH